MRSGGGDLLRRPVHPSTVSRERHLRRQAWQASALTLALLGVSCDRAPDASQPPPEVERPYEEGVDAQAQIDRAIAASNGDGRRVLLVFGANWCPWCRRLEHVIRNDAVVHAALTRGWRVVHVDVGADGSETNADVQERYGDPAALGLPCLVVLDDRGGVAHLQETGSLEDGDRHDPARVVAFLRDWRDG